MAHNPYNLIKAAGEMSLPTNPNDARAFWIGCIGIRKDGVLISAKNGASKSSFMDEYQYIPTVHAEGRALRKLGKGGILFVARIRRDTRKLAMSMPCSGCQNLIKFAGVKEVYFSINEFQYGKWVVSKDYYRTFDIKNEK